MSSALIRALNEEEPLSQDRWLVSYADLLTLMLAFFVVMYSVAQLNEQQATAFSEKLSVAFSTRVASASDIGDSEAEQVSSTIIDMGGNAGESSNGENVSQQKTDNSLEKDGDTIQQRFSGLNNLQIRGNEEWLQVELDSNLLFPVGGTELTTDALILLTQVAEVLRDYELPMKVEGFTDDSTVAGSRYASNWELSAARAAAVVRFLADKGVEPQRMAAVGYGKYQPVVPNDSPEGRARNRRVTLMIAKTPELRPTIIPIEPELFKDVKNDAGIFVQGINKSEEDSTAAAENLVEREMGERLQQGATPILPEGFTEQDFPASEQPPQFDTIELEGGGLLFTNKPGLPAASAQPLNADAGN
ncbi:MAG: OmpA family protein [Pseudomonadales bacterium]